MAALFVHGEYSQDRVCLTVIYLPVPDCEATRANNLICAIQIGGVGNRSGALPQVEEGADSWPFQ